MRRLVTMLLLATGCAACAGTTAVRPAPTVSAETASPDALYARGVAWARRGDLVRAEQYMALAVRAGYPHERALVALVEACLAASRLRAALVHAEPYLRRRPDAWRVRLLVGAIHAALGDDARARVELERVTTQLPSAVDAHYLLAILLHERLHDTAGAGASFRAYLAHAPHGPHGAEARAWLAEHTTRSGDEREGGSR